MGVEISKNQPKIKDHERARNMKYLEIKKRNWNNAVGGYTWFVSVKKEYAIETYGKRMFAFGDKVKAYLNGESDKIVHSGKRYNISITKFKSEGFPVYIIIPEGTNAPCALYCKAYEKFAGKYQRSSIATVSDFMMIDEDLKFFESYGYTEE